MLKELTAAALAVGAIAATVPAAHAQTVKVIVMQDDSDKDSLRRTTRIQNAVLNTFNAALNAPAASGIMRKYGIGGMDVYNEVSLTLPFDQQNRSRRSEQELLTVLSDIRNPRLDIVVLYTLYARAVNRRHGKYTALQMAMNYRALDVRSGRYLGGDNLDIDSRGVPFLGCAAGAQADRHCVREFVAKHAERLVEDAATTLATQVAALVAGRSGRRSESDTNPQNRKIGGKDTAAAAPRPTEDICRDLPRQFTVTFRRISKDNMHRLTRRMYEWPCRIDLGLDESSPSRSSYSYKVRANEAMLKRGLEMEMELLRIEGNVRTQGSNELIVDGIPLRQN